MATSAQPKYKPKRTLKPPAIQSRILAKRANGAPKARIARELGIAVNTVTSVLELNDFDRTLETEQATSATLIRPAINVMRERLELGSENAAIKVLENTIWPLSRKASRGADAGLTLAIQNLLMGPTQVNVAPAADSTTISASESRDNDKPHDNSNDNNKP